jgi:hypothetical protein
MTIDVGNNVQGIPIYGSLPVAAGSEDPLYRLVFKSRYNNKEADFTNTVLGVTRNDEYYTSILVSFEANIPRDVEGYYNMTIQYNAIASTWTDWKTYLVKVTNRDFTGEDPISYQSDNENNEQIIFYDNE